MRPAILSYIEKYLTYKTILMFDKEFYPTPRHVIVKMVEPHLKTLPKRNILEPSAGKGDILDYITNTSCYSAKRERVYAIEKDSELVYILQGKKYRILANDFLTYKPVHSFDLILMNPPFSNGDEHLLHAWNLLFSGDIVCLLNAETILNPYSKRRELLCRIIEQYGSYEILGDVFATAQRKTGVNIALVRLHKDGVNDRFKIDFETSDKPNSPNFVEDAVTGNQVAMYDKLGSYLHSWERTQEVCAEFIKARKKLEFYASTFMHVKDITDLINTECERTKSDTNQMETAYNAFIDNAKSRAWKEIIKNLGMDRFMTANLRKSFDEFCVSQGAFDLTRENIINLINFVCLNSGTIMKKAVADVYDIFIRFYKGNAALEEGWKTNSSYKVNRKVILPFFVETGWANYKTNYSRWDEYRDIDKVMCYLNGMQYEALDRKKPGVPTYNHKETIDDYEHLSLCKAVEFVRVGDNSLHESEFFQFRCYKKGTLHIIFKSEDLWAKFNIAATEGKMILGDGK